MSGKAAHEYEDWDEDAWHALGAEMNQRMCDEGDHYVVDGVCTACLRPVP